MLGAADEYDEGKFQRRQSLTEFWENLGLGDKKPARLDGRRISADKLEYIKERYRKMKA